ncbi:lactose-binding lectin l-2-like [Hemibagrus wyckioides]|uniref:lactose-binding lectin l-2-like n=1 Tax=Hemibagrus wyckioides TaxID=337641 RepID=UPI00266BF0A6|nr:lactose-binding lectin l-2-like [Hemibagrus wyckioides]
MVCQIRFSLLFVICVASTAFAPKWDEWVKDFLQDTEPENEYFSLDGSSCSPYCPSEWVRYGRRCFLYVTQHMNWTSAEKHCLDLGANLVSINSEDEYQMVKALIRAHDHKENPTWIGLTNCVETHNWFWSDGTELTFTKWNPDEPNNFESRECCVHMNFSVFMNWNDIPCEEKYPFVCVKRLK